MFFLTGMDFSGARNRRALSRTVRFSGERKRRVTNPVFGSSMSSHSDLGANASSSRPLALFSRSPALTPIALQMLTRVSTDGELTLFSTWLRNPSDTQAFSATALRVSFFSLRYFLIREPKFTPFPHLQAFLQRQVKI